jgi:hypothetical protein
MRTLRSARSIFWAQLPPPSVGGLRQRGPVTWPFALPHPAPSRRPRAISGGCGVARRRARAQACRTARSTDLQFVPVLTSFFAARVLPSAPAELTFGIRRRHSLAAIHGTHGGASGPNRTPSERSSGLPCSPSAPRHEVPGFGAVCSLVRLASGDGSRRCCRRSPLVSPSRPPVARLPSPSEPPRGEPVDRRDVCCCRADPEGSESPFTPHRVPSPA